MTTPGPENYKELLLFLATAGVIVPLFGRLKLSPVFGFLLCRKLRHRCLLTLEQICQ